MTSGDNSPRILIASSGLTGMTLACQALGIRLQISGYQVLIVAPKEIKHLVYTNDLDIKSLPEIREDYLEIRTQQHYGGKWNELFQGWKDRIKNQKKAISSLVPTEFIKTVKEYKPQLCLIDMELHEYILSLHDLEMKYVLLSQWFNTWPAENLPSLRTNIMPGSGFLGSKLGISLEWTLRKWKRRWIFWKLKFRKSGLDRRSLLLEYAKSIDFPIHFIKDNWWPGPYSYNGVDTWSMTIEDLEFPHNHPEHLKYVGPMTDPDREGGIETSLKAFIEKVKKSGRKLIVLCKTTMNDSPENPLKDHISEIMSTDYALVYQSQAVKKEDWSFGLPFLPMHFLLSKADVCIHHGGIHTIHECVYHKVPMLIFSGNKSDQNGCTARMVYHGLAIEGELSKISTFYCATLLEKSTNSVAIKNKIVRTYNALIKYEKEGLLEQLVSDKLDVE